MVMIRSIVRPDKADAVLAALMDAGFPAVDAPHASAWQILTVPVAFLGMVETFRCLGRRWSLYHVGVLILLYAELMILALVLFLCLYA